MDAGTGRPLTDASISVMINGTTAGTKTDENGTFSLITSAIPPFTLTVVFDNYITVTQTVDKDIKNLVIELEPENILGQEVVVSASRVPEEIIESPVSVERLGAETLRRTAAPSFYDAVANLKGVDISTQSLTFQSVNTRGFNLNGNVRFNQMIDGMDNQAPGLNFSLGNIVGLSDIDIDNIELLPGASSALYGTGGTNGTLLMISKNPFDYPGLTVQVRTGLNEANSGWRDLSLRYARVFNKRLGFKVSGSYFKAQDWEADDYSNFNRIARTAGTGDRNSQLDYDGVNVYGDEPNLRYPRLNMIGAGIKAQAANLPPGSVDPASAAVIGAFDRGLLPSFSPTRTGYYEKDLIDYTAKSIKTSAALHYKISNSTEAIAQANWGIGNAIYTGSDRYSLKNFHVGQYKLELKGNNFFLRGYTTQENSGDAYNATLLASLINEAWKPSASWLQEYTGVFSTARLQGASEQTANRIAREFADRDRPQPGSGAFNTLKNKIAGSNIGSENGAGFNDRSRMYHYEGMYNFSHLLKKGTELIVGSSYRVYSLNSSGTVFDDKNRDISIHEYSAYTQLSRRLGEKFRLIGSMRYDKNENFNGRLTPRLAGVLTVSSNKNIRASYQSGFRNPSTQNQYIDVSTAGNSIRLIGGLPEIVRKYNLYANKGYTDDSYRAFLATGNSGNLQPYTFDSKGLRPERVEAFELGYRGLFGGSLLIDSYAYYNIYKDFITGVELYQKSPTSIDPTGFQNATRFNVPVNNPGEVTSWGAALGFDYKLKLNGFTGNISYNKLGNIPFDYFNDFNTPEVRTNVGYSLRDFIKNASFYANYRWQISYLWQSPFVSGNVPSFGTVDAQISFKVQNYNSIVKIGGSNILNRQYRTSFGNPEIGGMYYISLLFDQFLK